MSDKTLEQWLCAFGVTRDLDEASHLCYSGSVRLNGITQTNAKLVPETGDTVGTLHDGYTYRIPELDSLSVL